MSFISSSSISVCLSLSGLGLVVHSKTPSWLLAAKTLTDILVFLVSFPSESFRDGVLLFLQEISYTLKYGFTSYKKFLTYRENIVLVRIFIVGQT